MVDIHCHILPSVDDGAADIGAALMMARMACDSGVKTVVATPHCNLPDEAEKNYVSEGLKKRFIDLREELRRADIPLTLLPGAEVMCTDELPELLRSRRVLTLAGTRYLLVEFIFDESLQYIENMLEEVTAAGLTPVVAHPERYDAVQRSPGVIADWFANGYVIQLNKGSVLGRLGRRAERAAGWILSRGLAHVVASDAHSPETRTTHMSEIRRFLEENCSAEYADALLRRNPARIIENRQLLRTL